MGGSGVGLDCLFQRREYPLLPCPPATDCVVSAIDKDLAVLSSSSASEQQLASLKSLGHWVGDIHPSLHVSFEDDRGGNSIGASGGSAAGTCTPSGTAASSSTACPATRTRWPGSFSARSPTTTGRLGGRPASSPGRTSPSRSRSARRSGTACAPTQDAGMTPTTSAWTRASLRRSWWSTVLHRDQHPERKGPPGQGRGPARWAPEPSARD